MNEEARRRRDVDLLQSSFYRAYDRSWIDQILSLQSQELDKKHERIGEGSHFTAWKLKSRGTPTRLPSTQADAATLVIKRPHQGFAGARTTAAQSWYQALKRLAPPATPVLVPPFEWLPDGDTGAMIMPYGDAPLTAAAAHWQPVAERWQELHESLGRLGVVLGGIDQARTWRGIPFIIVLSDLRLIERSKSPSRL